MYELFLSRPSKWNDNVRDWFDLSVKCFCAVFEKLLDEVACVRRHDLDTVYISGNRVRHSRRWIDARAHTPRVVHCAVQEARVAHWSCQMDRQKDKGVDRDRRKGST